MGKKSITLLATLTLTLIGCTSPTTSSQTESESASASPTTVASSTSSASATTTSTASAQVTPSLSPSTLTATSDESTGYTSNLSTEKANSYLVLNDFSGATTGWQDGVYHIAEKSDITGIGTELSSCTPAPDHNDMGDGFSNNTQTLRLNLGHKFDTLKFEVGQGNDSKSLNQDLAVRITDGSKQIGEITTVKFDEYKTVEISTKDRNVIFIQFYMPATAGESCYSNSIVPVIFNVELS